MDVCVHGNGKLNAALGGARRVIGVDSATKADIAERRRA